MLHYRHRAIVLMSLGIIAWVVPACRDDAARARAPADAIPPKVTVQGGSVEVGTAMTVLRRQEDVAGFAISVEPTTVAQFRMCVAAGVCSAPEVTLGTCGTLRGADGATYSDDPAYNSLPLTCASVAQAKQYCDWVGGRLPRLNEWVLAARGATVQRFSWGAAPPTCDRVARRAFLATDPSTCCDAKCDALGAVVGQRPNGASSSGLQDVLITRGELLSAQESSPYPACASPREACAIIGLVPGGIDHVIGAPINESALSIAGDAAAVGFRCAWEGTAQ